MISLPTTALENPDIARQARKIWKTAKRARAVQVPFDGRLLDAEPIADYMNRHFQNVRVTAHATAGIGVCLSIIRTTPSEDFQP